MGRRVPLVVNGAAEAGFLKAAEGCFVIACFCLECGLRGPEGGDVGGDGVVAHVAGEAEWVAEGGGVGEEEGEGGGGGAGVVGGVGGLEGQRLHIIYWPTATLLTQFHHIASEAMPGRGNSICGIHSRLCLLKLLLVRL